MKREPDDSLHPGSEELSGTHLVLTLLALRGVGRVVANKLIQLAPDLAGIRRYPREQVGHRLAGLPNGADIVSMVFDDVAISEAAAEANEVLRMHANKKISILTPLSEDYPARLAPLEERDKPAVLYAYGDPDSLSNPAVAFFGRPPVSDTVFDHCQALVENLAGRQISIILAGESGFCVALAKRALASGGPTVLVLSTGLDAVPRALRQTASLAARHGGAVVTPFPLGHGPFRHDRMEGARVMAALARVVVFANDELAEDHHEAADWATSHNRGVFTFSPLAGIPNAHVLTGPVDDEWLLAAAGAR